MDFRIEEPLASEPDLMTVVVMMEGRRGRGVWRPGMRELTERVVGFVRDYIYLVSIEEEHSSKVITRVMVWAPEMGGGADWREVQRVTDLITKQPVGC